MMSPVESAVDPSVDPGAAAVFPPMNVSTPASHPGGQDPDDGAGGGGFFSKLVWESTITQK